MMSRHRKKKRSQEKWTYEQTVEMFVQACGLRKTELERLRVRDFYQGRYDFVYEEQWIHVDAFDDLPAHEVPFEPNSTWLIAEVCKGKSTDDLVFSELPVLDYENLRDVYANNLFLRYYYCLGMTGAPNTLPGLSKLVKRALGLRHYDARLKQMIRWAYRDTRSEMGIS